MELGPFDMADAALDAAAGEADDADAVVRATWRAFALARMQWLEKGWQHWAKESKRLRSENETLVSDNTQLSSENESLHAEVMRLREE